MCEESAQTNRIGLTGAALALAQLARLYTSPQYDAKRCVHRFGIGKDLRHVGSQNNQIGSFGKAPGITPPFSSPEIDFLRDVGFFRNVRPLHKFSSRFWSLSVH